MTKQRLEMRLGGLFTQGVAGLVLPACAITLALVTGGVVIKLMGVDPVNAYRSLFVGSLGSVNGWAETLIKVAPLILTGLSFAMAFRSGLINIGAEGQLFIGGLSAVLAGIHFAGLPAFVHLPLALFAGFVGGGLWGLLAGWMKVRFGANEIITTVMLNYLAGHCLSFLVTGPLKEPGGVFPQTAAIAATAQLPRLLAGTRLHAGLLVALAALACCYVFLWHTPWGFSLRLVGLNSQAARYAGVRPESSVLLAMFLAGGLAGLAGAGEILGVQTRLLADFSPGYGYDGLAVGLLGANGPLGIILAAFLFAVLRSGGYMMQMFSGVPVTLVSVVQGLVILFVVAGNGLRVLPLAQWRGNRPTRKGVSGSTIGEGVVK
ncbi:MAG: ABC transporter permease [Bacteroidota bacterium]